MAPCSSLPSRLIFAGNPWREAAKTLRGTYVGPGEGDLRLSLVTWAADEAHLAIFFFMLSSSSTRFLVGASSPKPRCRSTADGGVITPALVFVGIVPALGETARPAS